MASTDSLGGAIMCLYCTLNYSVCEEHCLVRQATCDIFSAQGTCGKRTGTSKSPYTSLGHASSHSSVLQMRQSMS